MGRVVRKERKEGRGKKRRKEREEGKVITLRKERILRIPGIQMESASDSTETSKQMVPPSHATRSKGSERRTKRKKKEKKEIRWGNEEYGSVDDSTYVQEWRERMKEKK